MGREVTELELPDLLKECFSFCQTCHPLCCGIDAFEAKRDLLDRWLRKAKRTDAREALEQLRAIVAVIEASPSDDFSSAFLNHNTIGRGSRQRLIELFAEFGRALEPVSR